MKNKHQEEVDLFSEFPAISSQAWDELITKDLKGEDYNKKLVWHTIDGIDIQPYFRREQMEKLEHIFSEPGQYPFTRGRENNSWNIRQDIVVNKIEKANQDALNMIKNGVHYVGFKMSRVPPQQALKTLLEGIDLNIIAVNFSNSDCFRELAEILSAFVKEEKLNSSLINGSFDIDPFANMMLTGGLPDTLPAVAEKLYQIVSIVKNNLPLFRVLNVRAHIYHNSGASVTQQLGFALAHAHEYLVLLREKNLSTDDIAARMQMTFAVGSDYFVEIARLRAARYLFSRLIEQYEPTNPDSASLYITTVNSWWNKSIYDPHTNMLRATTEAMSAIIGGTDSLIVEPFDLSYKQPDDFSLRIARNLQSILKYESFLDKVADPSGGSYYIESLTDQIAQKSWEIFKEVEKRGGFMEAVKSGYIQEEIEKTVSKRNEMIVKRQENILGASLYPDFKETALDRIETIGEESTMPFGKLVKPIQKHRKAEVFENLRLRTESFAKKGNKIPKVFLLQIGNPGMSTARAIFSGNFFGTAGYQIINNPRFNTIDEGVEAALKSKAQILVVCSSDDEYIAYVPEIAQKLKSRTENAKLVVAGFPKDIIQQLREAGADDFIHIKSNLVEALSNYHQLFGIE